MAREQRTISAPSLSLFRISLCACVFDVFPFLGSIVGLVCRIGPFSKLAPLCFFPPTSDVYVWNSRAPEPSHSDHSFRWPMWAKGDECIHALCLHGAGSLVVSPTLGQTQGHQFLKGPSRVPQGSLKGPSRVHQWSPKGPSKVHQGSINLGSLKGPSRVHHLFKGPSSIVQGFIKGPSVVHN